MGTVRCLLLLLLVPATAVAQLTTRVSVSTEGFQATGPSFWPTMTPDGRYVVFVSQAMDLDSSGDPQDAVFWHDSVTGVTRFVASGFHPSVSDDGQFVAFDALTNGGRRTDVFVWTAATRTVQQITNSAQFTPSGGSFSQISGNGRFVLFLGAGIEVFDRTLQQYVLTGGAPNTVGQPRISADGRFVAVSTSDVFSQVADTNNVIDVYVLDRQTNTWTLASKTSTGQQGSKESLLAGLSGDGRTVLLTSIAPEFPGTRVPDQFDLFTKDLQTGTLTQVNVATGARFNFVTSSGFGLDDPTLSANGRWVVFASSASNLVAGDTNGLQDTFMLDTSTGNIVRVDVPVSGVEAHGGVSWGGVASSDGRFVTFHSDAHNLVPGDTNFLRDVFVRDFQGTSPCPVTFSPGGLSVVSNNGGAGTINLSSSGSCLWFVSVNVPWIHLSAATSGFGNGQIAYAFDANQSGTTRSGAIVANTATLGLLQPGAVTQPPFGAWDVPAGGTVSGNVAFSGWALDDVGVSRIRILRDPLAGESGPVFIGDAVRVAGARPDVESANPGAPFNTLAGWGLMVLTNMLPNQGNGTFTFRVFVDDVDGHTRSLGARPLTAANATATAPFGTIDTPGQGETVSGMITNFGWALTPQPKKIPTDGSTINVFIDGVSVGHPDYNHPRSDIQALFPGYANTDGAVGFFTFDTRLYADGVHTIAWSVTDDGGVTSGIGSRFFTIQNGPTPVMPPFLRQSARLATPTAQAIVRVGADRSEAFVTPDDEGVRVVRVNGLERIELHLEGAARPDACTRYAATAVPPGAALDPATGVFTWQPAAGLGGAHDVTVTRISCAASAEAIRVRIVFVP